MARQSIDDKERRDPRLLRLAASLGWSERETFAALFDVNAIAHDHVSEIISELDVNTVVWRDAPQGTPVDFDFASKMVLAGYAVRHSAKRMIRLVDMTEKIAYLRKKSMSGFVGGVNSAKARKKVLKQNPSTSAALVLAPDTPTAPDRSDREPPGVAQRVTPREEISPDLVASPSPGDFEEARPVPRLRVVGAQDELLREIAVVHAQEFQRVKAALGSGSIGPDTGGPHDELERLLQSIPPGTAREKCLHAIAVQAADALKKRTLQHFGAGMWQMRTFQKALTFDPLEIAGKPRAVAQARLPMITPAVPSAISSPTTPPPTYVGADDPEARAMIDDYDKTIAEITRATRRPP